MVNFYINQQIIVTEEIDNLIEQNRNINEDGSLIFLIILHSL